MVTLKKTPSVAIILAGGNSTRFGCDKAFYVPEGKTKTWVEELVAKLTPVVSLIYISIQEKQLGKMNILFSQNERIKLVVDEPELADYGPLGGLYSVSRMLHGENCLITPVDVPHIQTADFIRLLAAQNVYVKTKEHDHYLMAHLPNFKSAIASCIQLDEHRVTHLLEKLGTAPLFFNDELAFLNQNTPL